MVHISATRLRVKSIYYLIPFFIANEASAKQLRRTPGFLAGAELIDKNLTFWTLTMWSAVENMMEFRNSAPHRKAMQKLPVWCNEASYVHWSQEESVLPDWKVVYTKMRSEAKSTKVRNPSLIQVSMEYPVIKWTRAVRKFKPDAK